MIAARTHNPSLDPRLSLDGTGRPFDVLAVPWFRLSVHSGAAITGELLPVSDAAKKLDRMNKIDRIKSCPNWLCPVDFANPAEHRVGIQSAAFHSQMNTQIECDSPYAFEVQNRHADRGQPYQRRAYS